LRTSKGQKKNCGKKEFVFSKKIHASNGHSGGNATSAIWRVPEENWLSDFTPVAIL
jgi:hypothetical protein